MIVDILGKKYMRKYVLVLEMDDDMICHGIYTELTEAIGNMMSTIWEFAETCDEEGDIFEISKPIYRDSDTIIDVYFKKRAWNKGEHEYWHILESDTLLDREKSDTLLDWEKR